MEGEILKREPFTPVGLSGVRALVARTCLEQQRRLVDGWRLSERPFNAEGSLILDELDDLEAAFDRVLVDFARMGELIARLDGAA